MGKILRAIREAVSLAADLVGLKEGISWGALAGTITLAATLPYLDILVVFSLVVVSVAIVWLGIGLVRSTWGLSRWYDHDAYYVWVAAWLWINCLPRSAKIDEKSPAYSPLQKIKGAIQTKKIHVISGDGGMKSYISREELKKLALDKGEQPRFLFPDVTVRPSQPVPKYAPPKEVSLIPVSSLSIKDIADQMIDLAHQIDSFVENEGRNKAEQDLVNEYHARFASHLIYLYEHAERRGHQDADIKRYYEHPESLVNVRHIAQRIRAMGHRLQLYYD